MQICRGFWWTYTITMHKWSTNDVTLKTNFWLTKASSSSLNLNARKIVSLPLLQNPLTLFLNALAMLNIKPHNNQSAGRPGPARRIEPTFGNLTHRVDMAIVHTACGQRSLAVVSLSLLDQAIATCTR